MPHMAWRNSGRVVMAEILFASAVSGDWAWRAKARLTTATRARARRIGGLRFGERGFGEVRPNVRERKNGARVSRFPIPDSRIATAPAWSRCREQQTVTSDCQSTVDSQQLKESDS